MAYSHHPIQRPIKMSCIELCGGVHTAQRQISKQIPIGFCVNLLVSVSGSVSGSVNSLLMSGFWILASEGGYRRTCEENVDV